LDQANNQHSTIQASVTYWSLMRPGHSSITLLDQQSVSHALIDPGS